MAVKFPVPSWLNSKSLQWLPICCQTESLKFFNFFLWEYLWQHDGHFADSCFKVKTEMSLAVLVWAGCCEQGTKKGTCVIFMVPKILLVHAKLWNFFCRHLFISVCLGGWAIPVSVLLLVLPLLKQSCGDLNNKSGGPVHMDLSPFYKKIKLTWIGVHLWNLLEEHQMILNIAFLIIHGS